MQLGLKIANADVECLKVDLGNDVQEHENYIKDVQGIFDGEKSHKETIDIKKLYDILRKRQTMNRIEEDS